jgi:hypothetical protein
MRHWEAVTFIAGLRHSFAPTNPGIIVRISRKAGLLARLPTTLPQQSLAAPDVSADWQVATGFASLLPRLSPGRMATGRIRLGLCRLKHEVQCQQQSQ